MTRSLRNYFPYIITFLLWCAYAWFTLDFDVTLTARQQQWGQTESNTIALQASIVGFYLIVWMIATHGILILQRRAKLFRQPELAAGFRAIVWGLITLLVQLIIVALIGTVKASYESDPYALMIISTLTTYIHSFFPAAGFILVFLGVKKLTKNTLDKEHSKTALLITGILALLYLGLVFTNTTRSAGLDAEIRQTYYLTDWMIVLTVILPALVGWFYGVRSLLILHGYRNPAVSSYGLSRLTMGIGSLLASSITLHAITAMGAQRMLDMGLLSLVGIIYLFFAFLLIGFYLAIQGATRLEAEIPVSPLAAIRL